jgi:5-hydroxyisourate hydrolase
MPGLSVHVVDVTRGLPARGMRVHVHRSDGEGRQLVARGEVGADGTMAHAITGGAGITRGTYDVELFVGDYFRSIGADVGTPAFQETSVFRFNVVDPAEHYHLPVKLSPYGLSVWRGR